MTLENPLINKTLENPRGPWKPNQPMVHRIKNVVEKNIFSEPEAYVDLSLRVDMTYHIIRNFR